MSSNLLAEKIDVLNSAAATCVIMTDGMSARAVLRLRGLLSALRFRVITCDSASSALCACQGRSVSLLLTAGTERGQRLLARSRHLEGARAARSDDLIRIALLAEDEGPEAVLEMLMAGADECLVWPFGEQVLAQRLRLLMQAA